MPVSAFRAASAPSTTLTARTGFTHTRTVRRRDGYSLRRRQQFIEIHVASFASVRIRVSGRGDGWNPGPSLVTRPPDRRSGQDDRFHVNLPVPFTGPRRRGPSVTGCCHLLRRRGEVEFGTFDRTTKNVPDLDASLLQGRLQHDSGRPHGRRVHVREAVTEVRRTFPATRACRSARAGRRSASPASSRAGTRPVNEVIRHDVAAPSSVAAFGAALSVIVSTHQITRLPA